MGTRGEGRLTPSAGGGALALSQQQRTASVHLAGVRKRFGDVVAVEGVDLEFEAGAFVTLLGPSGCGKTTILRMVAGLEVPSDGEIRIAGQRVNELPIHERNLGLVFQNYALFPHKNVFDNIAFGLRYRQAKIPRNEIAVRVGRALDIVRLPGVEKRLPSQLSGGQQQRVALARAIVIEPDVLLLDEPLSALDANLREQMRVELKSIQREIGVTTVFVTHDQDEALAMSDQIVVMDHGRVEQVGSPQDCYSHPATRFVAGFLGQSNILAGEVEQVAAGRARVRLANGSLLEASLASAAAAGGLAGRSVEVVVRAHRAQVRDADAPAVAGASRFAGRIDDLSYLGGMATYFIDVAGTRCLAINPIGRRMFERGEAVTVHVAADDCTLLDEHGRRIG